MRRKGKESCSSSTITEALTAREIDFNHRKGKGDIGKSKTGSREDLKKNQCAYYKEVGHKKIDCLKLTTKKESKSESKIVMAVGNGSDSFSYSLSINPFCFLFRGI